MEAIIERCCGIDVHKKTITVCLMIGAAGESARTTIKTFSTLTPDLLACRDWLIAEGCTHAVLESTGVYWKPLFNVLEDAIEVVLANARHVKNVPGRKTDVKDCEWLAQLLRHGLIKGSFIPPKPVRQLRDLTRYRQKLVQQRAAELNRLQKFLEDANIKLSSVVSDINGVSAQQMIQHLIADDMSPEQMAQLAKGRLRSKLAELEKALMGHLSEHQRLMLKVSLQVIGSYDEAIEKLSQEIGRHMLAFEPVAGRLQSIPGVKKNGAERIIAEIGVDMNQFPSDAHVSSWAGISPGNNESAGKRYSGRSTPGNKWLKACLVEAAWAASKTKNTYLKARYHRLAARRGKKRAIVAIGHTILIMAYHIIKEQSTYKELGADYFERLNEQAIIKRLTARIQNLGYQVELTKTELAA
jgi:transposase